MAYNSFSRGWTCLSRIAQLEIGSWFNFKLCAHWVFWDVGRQCSTIALISVATTLYFNRYATWDLDGKIHRASSYHANFGCNANHPNFCVPPPCVNVVGIGKVPGLIAVCVYAMPPMVRLTNLGIRLVDSDVGSCQRFWSKR